MGGDEVENLRADAIDAGELMAPFRDAQFVANVSHKFILHGEVLCRAIRTDGESSDVLRGFVLGNELVDGDVGEDVAIVDNERIVSDEGGDVLNAATGFEEDFFVEEVKLDSTVVTLWEGAVPFFMEVVSIDGHFFGAS